MEMNQNLPAMQSSPNGQKPGKVQAIAIMTLVSGILNIFWGLILTLMVIIGTIGIGILCAPVTIAPTVLGIFEVIAGSKLLSSTPRRVKVQTIAILEIISILTLSMISVVIGILNLVFYNESEVKQYIDSLPR